MCFGNTVEFTKMALCLIPKVLYSVYVVMLFGKMCAVIDAVMAEFTGIKYIVASIAVGINNAVGSHLFSNNRQQCNRLCIGNRYCINPTIALQKPEYNAFPRCATSALTFALATKIAFINFYLAIKHF